MEHCVFAVITGGKRRILLVENAPKYFDNGRYKERGWGLPGGSVKNGEGEIAALVREVEEETGFKIAVRPEDLLAYEKGDDRLIFLCKAKVVGGRLKIIGSNDVITAAWFPINHLPDSLYNNHRRRIKECLA